MYTSTAVEILISSPSDVGDARDAIQEEIAHWNTAHARLRGVSAVAVRWESDSVPELGDHPQVILNRQLVDRCDLLVAVFRDRFGTPTPSGLSGTAEKIERFTKSGKPVLLYVLKSDAASASDVEQRAKLDAFIQSLRSRGLFREVADVDGLRSEFRTHLSAMLAEFEHESKLPPVKLSDVELGLLKHLGEAGRTFVEELSGQTDVGVELLTYHFERLEAAGLVDHLANAVSGQSFVLNQRGRAELFTRGLLR